MRSGRFLETVFRTRTSLRLVPGYDPVSKDLLPETELSHFDTALKEYVKKYKITQDEFIEAYNEKRISKPKLDEYFMHDRGLEGKAAYLATVDLNSLLCK